MKLCTYKIKQSDKELIALVLDNKLLNLNNLFGDINLTELVQKDKWQNKVDNFLKDGNGTFHNLEDVILKSPIPKPNSFRDAYAFRQHVETCRLNRGADMVKEFDDFPVFYFSNHNAIFGPNESIKCMPSHFMQLDYELEFAILIGKEGENILAKDAGDYIAGFMILNDFSARDLQKKEMKLNLGPAKGKDFASVLGPYLVTPDEIKDNLISKDKNGSKYSLEMRCYVNGELLSSGNTKNMNWTFEQIIERASYGAKLYPGDIIGSGTVGTGCLLELNGTRKLENAKHKDVWLKEGDVISLKIDGLGETSNKIIAKSTKYMIK